MTELTTGEDLRQQFGDIDIYLFDQILRGRFDSRQRVLDAGCGDGRNLVYLLQHGFECYGVDSEPSAVDVVRQLASRLAPSLPSTNFAVAEVTKLPHPDGRMHAVICSAGTALRKRCRSLHAMVTEMWRVLARGGLFFARLASNIGLEQVVGPAGRQVRLPDGSDRFLVDESMLLRLSGRLGGRLADPIKTTNVQGKRCMTTWCLIRE